MSLDFTFPSMLVAANYKRRADEDEEDVSDSNLDQSLTVEGIKETSKKPPSHHNLPLLYDRLHEGQYQSADAQILLLPPIKSVDLAPVTKVNPMKLSSSSLSSSLTHPKNSGELLDWTPMVGPQRQPLAHTRSLPFQNTFVGLVQDEALNFRHFDREMIAFSQDGVSMDPSGQCYVYNASRLSKIAKSSPADATDVEIKSSISTNANTTSIDETIALSLRHKKSRSPSRDPSNVHGFIGTWNDLNKRKLSGPISIQSSETTSKETSNILSPTQNEPSTVPSNTQSQPLSSIWHAKVEESLTWLKPDKSLSQRAESRLGLSVEHIAPQVLKLLKDNLDSDDSADQPRSAMSLVQKIKPLEFEHYLPKKCIHTWGEASKAVSSLAFIPKYGHLLLTSSMDHALRIYEVYGKRRCLFTYLGHSHAVRHLDWQSDGLRFLSCSYDKQVKLWDTETGQVLDSFNNHTLPIVARFYPVDPNILIVGQSDKKIVQWDIRSNQIVQEYNRHLGAINTITWIDDYRRFVTSSDDKSIRVWEYNIPVDIKYIAEPHMHSMPSITLHPNQKWFLCQSLDNQILVYSTKDRFRLNRQKRFLGHTIAGYACGISVSPDGRCVTSGDSHGNLVFWDWKTTRLLKKIKAHENTAIDVQWHPLEPSRIASAGWDNVTKLWD